MDLKTLSQRFRQRFHVDLWFLGGVLAIAAVTFIVSELAIGAVVRNRLRTQMEILPLEERGVYDGDTHTLKEDLALLSKNRTSHLNGAKTAAIAGTEQPIAVVVENYTPIRGQQAGLEGASLIYETLAEGGITRLLALFDGAPVDRIGPVRSARPYFVTWASEYRAAFTHVGGSNEALGGLKNNFRIFNIDEFSDFITIWRDRQYLAPHNAYTSTEKIHQRLKKADYSEPLTSPRFPFKENDATSGTINTVTIDFSLTPYAVKYVYDPATHLYSRFNGGKSHHDLKPANVLVQFVDMEVLDDVGRLRLQTHGTGKSIVFRDGQAIEGTWEKDSSINSDDQPASSSWTKFFDKEGKEISLNRGQTWIEVVPNGRTVNYF